MPRCTALIDDLHRMHCRNEPYHTVEASFSSLNELSTQAKSVLHMMHTVVVYCASVHSAGTMQTKCNSTVLFLNLNLPQLFGTLLGLAIVSNFLYFKLSNKKNFFSNKNFRISKFGTNGIILPEIQLPLTTCH